MTVDVAFHEKETEEGGIRPMLPDRIWCFKQHRVYRIDEDGKRIRDQNDKFFFDAVPTTDWETRKRWNIGEKHGLLCVTPSLP